MMVPDMNKTLTHVQMINIPNKYSPKYKIVNSKWWKIFCQFVQIYSKCRWHFYQNVAVRFLSI